MSSNEFQNLESWLKTLQSQGDLTSPKKQAIRDRVFRSIGQIELADAIAEGESKAKLVVSLKHLQQALIPHRLSFSMPATIMTVMVVFLGSIVTGAAAQGAKPGDALFAMKKVIESIEMAVVSNPVKKAEMSLNIAGERLQYLENSVGTEAALHEVLLETQTALVSAKATIKKAQESGGNEKEAAAVLEKFNALLADQKTILEDIEKETESEEIKNTVVAIRDVIEGKGETTSQNPAIAEQPSPTVAVTNPNTPKTSVQPVSSQPQPLTLDTTLQGRQTLMGRIGTSGGQAALFVGNQYYIIASSPVWLQSYIGNANVKITGDIQNGQLTAYQVFVDSVLVGGPSSLVQQPSTGGSDTLQ